MFSDSHSGNSPTSSSEGAESRWYALYTRPRHEKQVTAQLERKRVECFLPLYDAVRRWKDRRARVQLPLFPGYVFVRVPLPDRIQILNLPGAVRFVSFNGRPAPLQGNEIEALRRGLTHRLRADPCPYLRVGRRVRVKSGPLAGAEGILMRKKERFRLVLSVDLIMRSVALEVDSADVEPLR